MNDGLITRTPGTETAVLAGGCFWGMEDLIRRQPGVLDTRARFLRLHSLLIRLDLPTLDRPEKANSGRSGAGSWLEMP